MRPITRLTFAPLLALLALSAAAQPAPGGGAGPTAPPPGTQPATRPGTSDRGGTSMTITVDPQKLILCGPAHDPAGLTLRLLSPQDGTVSVAVSQLTTGDGCGHMPPSAVTVNGGGGVSSARVSANSPTTLPVGIDVSHVSSGEYTGDVLLQPLGGGSPVRVPIIVRLKDRPFWVLVVLLLGVGLSYLLSWYREVGRRRDQLILLTARLQDMLTNDAELGKFESFREALTGKLTEISHLLSGEQPNFAAAETAAKAADGIAANWYSWRDRWARARASYEALSRDAAGNPGASATLDAARHAMEDAPTAGNPKPLEDALRALDRQLHPAPAGGTPPAAAAPVLPNVHFAPRRAIAALWRERTFEYVSIFVALAMLCFAGYRELYEANPTFGARGFTDYAAVFIWGFGAEATRSSVVAVVRNWGIHGFA